MIYKDTQTWPPFPATVAGPLREWGNWLDGRVGDAEALPMLENRPGVLGWWLNSKVLKKKVLPKGQLRAFRWILPLLKLEESSEPSFGMSLLVVARRA